ncbi:MAG: T9SS type A sorting domain-containing protein, partial [Chitinophagales bacterium]
VSNNKGQSDFWLVRTDSLGNILWSTTLGGSAIDAGNAFTQLPDGNYVVAGSFDSDDGDVLSHHGTTDHSDVWVAKVIEGNAISSSNAINEISFPISVIPNPANLSTNIFFTLENSDAVYLQLLNSESQEIENARYEFAKSGRQQIDLNTAYLPPGIYFIRLISGAAVSQKLLVVAR